MKTLIGLVIFTQLLLASVPGRFQWLHLVAAGLGAAVILLLAYLDRLEKKAARTDLDAEFERWYRDSGTKARDKADCEREMSENNFFDF